MAAVRARHDSRSGSSGSTARRRARARDARLAGDRADTRGARLGARPTRVLEALRQTGDRAARDALGHARLGERRRAARTSRPARRRRSRRSRGRLRQRYPWVRRWVVWNEPNQRRWLSPPSPTVYVTRLLNPAAAAIKAVDPAARRWPGARPLRAAGAAARRRSTSSAAMGARRRAARRVRAPSASALARRDAVDGRLRALRDDHDGDARAARTRGRGAAFGARRGSG